MDLLAGLNQLQAPKPVIMDPSHVTVRSETIPGAAAGAAAGARLRERQAGRGIGESMTGGTHDSEVLGLGRDHC
ncbi:Hypothetical predicted protein [Xyrichtys novacula]|uniref:Uncharacterized protein n=1 Tax=Xyrichtys novacula TaxID=13765 RepID=A0AAV1EQ21_XYRNO|nr:Hypothetical predicted protein [Xyrichtys novacula]